MCGQVHGVFRDPSSICRVVLDCPIGDGITSLLVFVNGELIQQDPTTTGGWNFTDASMSAFAFSGQLCTDVGNGAALDIDYLCELP
jgi:hypothetical protein